MGAETVALAALLGGYVDAKYDFFRDLVRAKQLISANLTWWLAQKRDEVNVSAVFEHYAKTKPHHLFLVFPEPIVEANPQPGKPLEDLFVVRSLTYAQAYDRVQRYAAFLTKEQGVKAGDIVALDFLNSPEYVIAWFSLWHIGATPALINYNLQGKSLVHCVKVSNSKLLIADAEAADNALAASSDLEKELGVKTVIADSDHFEYAYRNYEPMSRVHVSSQGYDAACYIFTSGTTGLPKAATFSWKKAYWGATLYANVNYYTGNQVLYSAMPLYHSTAACLGLLATLQKGGTYAIGHKFSTTTFWTQAMLSGATAIQYVGETCRYLLNAPPGPHERRHRVRAAFGNGMRPDIWLKFKERFNIPVIGEFYGATEFPSAITNIQSGVYGIGSVGAYGRLATAVMRHSKWDIAAIDPDTQELWRDPKTGLCRVVEVGEPGEFLFKVDAANVIQEFQGYTGNKKATEEKLAFDVFSGGDAYVRTGDLLKYDENYHVYFVDRLGDTFRWKSENVSTNEVEEAISEFGGIDISVCVGVKVPKHEGRAGLAVIKPSDPTHPPDIKQLSKHLLGRLPRYAVPVFIKFIDNISITGNNKIQKKAFRDQKIPAPEGEVLWWLVGDEYVPLTPDSWSRVEAGSHKL